MEEIDLVSYTAIIYSCNCDLAFCECVYIAPDSGLYFTLNGILYLPGESVFFADIGKFVSETDPGTSLVCVTSNINMNCCRRIDGPNDSGNVGEWYFPDGTIVPRHSAAPSADFTRSGFIHQVRLNRRNNALTPNGIYECRVPDGLTGEMMNATITLERG